MMRRAALLCVLALAGLGCPAARAQLISANDYWRYPSIASYTAVPNDSGSVFSAYNAGGTFTLTLPANASTLPSGWHVSVVNDNGHQVTVQVNATSGGQILYPAAHASSSVTTAAGNYEFLSLEYDNSGNFRVTAATPETAAAIGISGSTGGCLTGPGSSTAGYVVSWGSSTGCALATGYPVGNSGIYTVLETNSSGQIGSSTLPSNVVTGPGVTTAGYVAQWGNTSGNALATGTPLGNAGANTVMETDSSGHLATATLNIQASGSGGQPLCVNGSTLYLGSGGAC